MVAAVACAVIEVAAHRPRRPDQHLSRLAGTRVQAGRTVDHPALDARQQRADELRIAAAGVRHDMGRAAEFGHSVGLLDPATQPLRAFGGQRSAERGGAGGDQAQAGHVVPGQHRVPGQGQHDRRNHLDPGHAVLLDQPQEVLEVEPGHGDHGGSLPQGQAQRDLQGEDMEAAGAP